MIELYLLALGSLIIGTAGIHLSLIERVPISWVYYNYFLGRWITWTVLLGTIAWLGWGFYRTGTWPDAVWLPLTLMVVGVIASHKIRQEKVFQAVDNPEFSTHVLQLPIPENAEMAVIDFNGVTKSYPLDYVIHHHIINDRFGEKTVSLTYCAMCRTVIPFDVTDIGPLFVAAFKNANMIVADRATKTFFQQASFQSVIGPLHPKELVMIPYQILPWSDVKALVPVPQVVDVNDQDLRKFELPIPRLWSWLLHSENTPGLSRKNRDSTYKARTRVIGLPKPPNGTATVFLKQEILDRGVVSDDKSGVVLIVARDAVNGFELDLDHNILDLSVTQGRTLLDGITGTSWDLRGRYISGEIVQDLVPVRLSDEYWFSWKLFHPEAEMEIL